MLFVPFFPRVSQPRDNSDVLPLDDKTVAVVRVHDYEPSQVKPLTEVRPDIEKRLLEEKLLAREEEEAQKFLSELQGKKISNLWLLVNHGKSSNFLKFGVPPIKKSMLVCKTLFLPCLGQALKSRSMPSQNFRTTEPPWCSYWRCMTATFLANSDRTTKRRCTGNV